MVGMSASWDWSLDGWIVAAGALCAVSAALLGNFLVLRRLSLLGDAISHAVLPGLAAAFFLTGSRSSWPMFVGAAVVGVLTAILTEWVRSEGRVDEGASMGVVFTTLFALGLVMIVQAADHVDLDASCVLHGAIEMTPLDTIRLGEWSIPRVVVVLGAVCLVNLLFVICCFKELTISAFDPSLATAAGISATVMHYALTTLVALTAVASFETVGNILVVAMFVAPPATAFLCTKRLTAMVTMSVLFAIAAAVLGHLAAMRVPAWFGLRSTSTAGMMAVTSGVLFAVAALVAPQDGVIPRWWRHRVLMRQILSEDLLGVLYRREERQRPAVLTLEQLQHELTWNRTHTELALRRLVRKGSLHHVDNGYALTDRGREQSMQLVRSHRLWERYLVDEAGLDTNRIHDRAEQLEHYTTRELRDKLEEQTPESSLDPHGSPIPPEEPGG